MPSDHQPVGASPASTGTDEDALDTPDRRTAPGAAHRLRRIDPSFPLLPDSEWSVLFEQLAESWRRVKPSDQTTGTVNRLTRSARDRSRAAGLTLSRRTLEHVTKAILGADEPPMIERGKLGGQALADVFAAQTLERMVELKILDDSSSRAGARVERWITGPSNR